LNFFNSRNVIDFGGTDKFINAAGNFSQPFLSENEDLAYEFLIG